MSKEEIYNEIINFRLAEPNEDVCDNCNGLEDGGHYCLIHTKQVKNADIMRCDYIEVKS